MTEAVLGTFADCKILKTRSVLQIIVEIPIEQADEALKALGGIPQPSEERWVGLARAPKERRSIKETCAESMEAIRYPNDKRPFNSLPLSQQAAIRCHDAQFKDFLQLRCNLVDEILINEAEYVRGICGVDSRSELDTNDIAAAKWRKLEEDFQAYLTDIRYAGTSRL